MINDGLDYDNHSVSTDQSDVKEDQSRDAELYWKVNKEFGQGSKPKLGCPIFCQANKAKMFKNLPDWGNLAVMQPSLKTEYDQLYLNTHEPFAAVMVGVQGAGKSHTANTIIENCMVTNSSVCKVRQPLSTIVCHYDQSQDIVCESVSLGSSVYDHQLGSGAKVREITVLVSPSNFFERQKTYKNLPNVKVRPLLLQWSALGAVQIKQIMGITSDNNNQLYMCVLLKTLRQLQKYGKRNLTFAQFKEQLEDGAGFQRQQSGPLQQRFGLVESMLYESRENSDLRKFAKYENISDYFRPGDLVVVDLTDPFIDQKEANSIFQVVLSMYIEKTLSCGKLIVFDEAHKYIDKKAGELCNDVVRLVRQMRHYGCRVIVSTQSPGTLQAELLELASFVIMHRFYSPDWFNYMKQKIPMPEEAVNETTALETGEALLFCPRAKIESYAKKAKIGPHLYRIMVRERITKDTGETVVNLIHRHDYDLEARQRREIEHRKLILAEEEQKQLAREARAGQTSARSKKNKKEKKGKRGRRNRKKSSNAIPSPPLNKPRPPPIPPPRTHNQRPSPLGPTHNWRLSGPPNPPTINPQTPNSMWTAVTADVVVPEFTPGARQHVVKPRTEPAAQHSYQPKNAHHANQGSYQPKNSYQQKNSNQGSYKPKNTSTKAHVKPPKPAQGGASRADKLANEKRRKKRFKCTQCNQKFHYWEFCLEHQEKTGHRGSVERCRISSKRRY